MTAGDILSVPLDGKTSARWSEHYQRLCAERDRLLPRDFCPAETRAIGLDDLPNASLGETVADRSFVVTCTRRETIFEVLAALQRIERGTYGTCELTGLPIEPERLEAIPWARYSLEGDRELTAAGSVSKQFA